MAKYPSYHRYLDPAEKVRVSSEQTETPLPTDRSYLGRWEDSGWSIQIEPKLTDEQWSQFKLYSGLMWNPTIEEFDVNLAMKLLALLFPRHLFTILIPKPIRKKKER
jgi:hypothetical protein